MIRISGITIPDNKKIKIALTHVFGIGRNICIKILKSTNIDPEKKAKDLSVDDVNAIQGVIDKEYKIEGDLKREISNNIKRLREVGSWRGMRHAHSLPIHGRSKTNSRTKRGNVRKTMGSGRKSASAKT